MSEQQPQPRPHRRAYIVAGIAALAVLLGGGGYLLFGGSQSGSPSSVVVAYLRALARSDARGALSFGLPPSDTSLLTSNILRQQQQLGPITAIKVVGTDTGDYGAVVQVKYRVGDQPVDDHFELVRRGNGWRLDSVAVEVLVSGTNFLPAPKVLGEPLGSRAEVFVFPGVVTFGSVDENFALTPVSAVYTDPSVPTSASPKAVLNSVGSQAATRIVRSAMATCAHTRQLAPHGCPQRAARPHVARLVAGSLRWSAPGEYSHLTVRSDSRRPGLVHVSGRLTWTLHYRVRAVHAKRSVPHSLVVRSTLLATIDFNTSPPGYKIG